MQFVRNSGPTVLLESQGSDAGWCADRVYTSVSTLSGNVVASRASCSCVPLALVVTTGRCFGAGSASRGCCEVLRRALRLLCLCCTGVHSDACQGSSMDLALIMLRSRSAPSSGAPVRLGQEMFEGMGGPRACQFGGDGQERQRFLATSPMSDTTGGGEASHVRASQSPKVQHVTIKRIHDVTGVLARRRTKGHAKVREAPSHARIIRISRHRLGTNGYVTCSRRWCGPVGHSGPGSGMSKVVSGYER